MPFDPTLPAPNAPLQSQVLRNQLQALHALILAGSPITSVGVDGVVTLPPGDAATAAAALVGNALRFNFGLPQGAEGPSGPAGSDGSQGPPFADAVVEAVNTLPPGDAATVGVSFDGVSVRFTFGLPAGASGADGLPGEVSQVDLNNAVLGVLGQTSNGSNGVDSLAMAVSDPPTQGEMQAMANKIDELIAALRR